MTEPLQRRRERIVPGPSGPGNIFDDNTDGHATVCYGIYKESLPVDGMSVEEVRQRFGDRFDIDPRSQAVLDGNEVGENAIVQSGQILTFVRKAGEKAYGQMLYRHQ